MMSHSKFYVNERIFLLDCARKYFTPDWIKRLIDEISSVGYNAIIIHFSEDIGLRLESKQYPWLAGGDHTLCVYGEANGLCEDDETYLTQDEMADIVRHAQSRGMDVIPSLDSPGHMNYAVKKYNAHGECDIGNYFHKNGKVSIVQGSSINKEPAQTSYSRGIDIANPEAVKFAKNLYTEYGLFFRSLGCRSFCIGGDELLGFGETIDDSISKWNNLDHWEAYAKKLTGNPHAVAYDAFLLYMNDMAALLRSIGYTSVRMWNDDAYRSLDTGWTGAVELDPSIDILFWSPNANDGKNTAQFYIEQGHNIYNFTLLYTYYTLYPNKAPSHVTPHVIMKEWNPYVFAPDHSECTTNNTYLFPPPALGNFIEAPNEKVKGAGFCLWTDTPAAETEDEILEHIRPYFTAVAKKALGGHSEPFPCFDHTRVR